MSKKIGVQVDIERAETEVNKYVTSQNAGSAALTAIKTAKNKIDELVARDKFDRTETETLNASTFIIIKNKSAESKRIAMKFTIVSNSIKILIYSAGDRDQPLYFSVSIWLNNGL